MSSGDESPTDAPIPAAAVASPPRNCDARAELNPYSCSLCRRRKKKCDRIHPVCTICRKLNVQCTYPPRKKSSRKPASTDPLERLRQLEDVMEHLRGELGLERSNVLTGSEAHTASASSKGDEPSAVLPNQDDIAGLEVDLGRLAIGAGQTRYVLSSFWASLNDEVSREPEYTQSRG
jgi:hypothetical protein